MVVSLKHLFESAKTDGPDITLVQPSNWNAEHVLTQATSRLLGRTTAGTGPTEEISVSANLALSGGQLDLAGSVSVTALTAGTLTVTGTGAVKIATGTTAQRPTPATGQFRFNTTLGKFEGYDGAAWGAVGGGATGGGADDIFIQNGQVVTTNYTIPADKNAMSTGPITINAGVTITVSTGARYVVI
jgi:hypothetical protein